LIEWIKNHQDTAPADEEDFEEFKNLVWKVKQVVFDAACALRTALFHFCVPLDQVLMDAMSSVNLRLASEGYTQVWIEQLDHLKHKQGKHSYLMLCEPHLLLEVLRNLLSNVRYSVDEDHKQDLNSEHIRLHIESRIDKLPEPEGSEHEFIILVVETEGLSYSERTEGGIQVGGTFRSHQARIKEFGGNLSISDGPDGKGSRAELKLISRINYNGIA
jgi:hypothetical protein